MQIIKVKEKEYKVENLEISIRCILSSIEKQKEYIEEFEKEGMTSLAEKEKQRLAGLEAALYFLTDERE